MFISFLIHIKGEVRLGDNGIAEIETTGADGVKGFKPICGHWFWDGTYGASLFCQSLGYPSGTIGDKIALPSDGVRIGGCQSPDTWPYCSKGCNDHSIGGTTDCDCQSGAMAGIKIHCTGKR